MGNKHCLCTHWNLEEHEHHTTRAEDMKDQRKRAFHVMRVAHDALRQSTSTHGYARPRRMADVQHTTDPGRSHFNSRHTSFLSVRTFSAFSSFPFEPLYRVNGFFGVTQHIMFPRSPSPIEVQAVDFPTHPCQLFVLFRFLHHPVQDHAE